MLEIGRFVSCFTALILPVLLISPGGAQKKPESNKVTQTPTTSAPNTSKQLPTRSDEAESEVVRIDTDLVNTLFTAVDKDRLFVTNLQQPDIRVYENGVEQQISLFERETDRPLTLVILVDTSKSQERTLPVEKKAASTFVNSIIRPEKDRAAIVSFTGQPKIEQGLTNQIARLNQAIENLQVLFPQDNPGCETYYRPVQEDPLCWTSIWDSVWASADEILGQTREGNRRAIILLTDGDDTSSTIKQQDAIEAAVKNDTVVYGIGIGDEHEYHLDKKAIRKVCERTGGRAFFPSDDSELLTAFAQIQQELRSQYVVAYAPKNKARDGSYRQVKIEIVNPSLRKRKLTLKYRQGYYAAHQKSD